MATPILIRAQVSEDLGQCSGRVAFELPSVDQSILVSIDGVKNFECLFTLEQMPNFRVQQDTVYTTVFQQLSYQESKRKLYTVPLLHPGGTKNLVPVSR